ncbi:hypothetical protein L0P88_08875 [Muricauda sp. SCSIO 64092]|uniref:hypothetical protein n=1 Tax=Allomuricauda sp. SCSIO 64092 TaxID=2908842 RepID=UPI001FF68271|nr:hypothetical protein [Muricauda sp. SCSIO 64092]UOY08652.1 hypothetical protein L0P88_08875 [Muricauda sp. SCSIO 64092]
MLKSPLIPLAVLLAMNFQVDEVYVGKTLLWQVYYDPNKVNPIVEIGGAKYGYHDHLKRKDGPFAMSKVGKLYWKNQNLYYKNETLKIDLKLKRKNYNSKIDLSRLKIFEIKAFAEISKLKDSLKVSNYEFDWKVKDDYVFYRENDSLPENYTSNYINKFYEKLD